MTTRHRAPVVPSATRAGRGGDLNRDAALDAALQLFWRRGYAHVTATDLAEAMGIQRASFYNAFGSREDTFLAVLARYDAAAPFRHLDALPPGEPVLPALVAMFRHICRVRSADDEARGCLVGNAMADLGAIERRLADAVLRSMDDRVDTLAALLHQAVRQGELPAHTDVPTLARTVAAFIVGLNTFSRLVRGEAQLWAMASDFLRGQGLLADAPAA